jgi:hypothetical protein
LQYQHQLEKNLGCSQAGIIYFPVDARGELLFADLPLAKCTIKKKFNHGSDQLYFAVKKHIFCSTETDTLGAPRDTIRSFS